MAPKFGTSGLRGLVTELSDALCAAHVRAFLAVCPHGGRLLIGRDLRPSSPRIAAAVAAAAAEAGLDVADCGAVPTPALALAAAEAGAAAIMVTGSHIPADRNGLKFYTQAGEITKADEDAILAALDPAAPAPAPAAVKPFTEARDRYLGRYRDAFGPAALAGLTVGVWEHSSVAGGLLHEMLRALGAATVPLGRASRFVPVDTEAIDAATRDRLAGWAARHRPDAIVSTDGDADRPLVADAAGQVVPGDVIGTITAARLGADTVVTPVSSNSLIERSGRFARVIRTRIGSPHVIAAMEAAMAAPGARVAGFEANGGFLLGFAAACPAGPLAPLMTRDAALPIVATLAAMAADGRPLAALLADLPRRFTAADRLEGAPTAASQALVAGLAADPARRADFFAGHGAEAALDRTDGLRVSFASGLVLHLRPSGNAPELRCYAEADSPEAAREAVAETLARAAAALRR
ncbi:phosphohexomutase domain-containing protein [Albidovulum sp.]